MVEAAAAMEDLWAGRRADGWEDMLGATMPGAEDAVLMMVAALTTMAEACECLAAAAAAATDVVPMSDVEGSATSQETSAVVETKSHRSGRHALAVPRWADGPGPEIET